MRGWRRCAGGGPRACADDANCNAGKARESERARERGGMAVML